MKRTLKNTLKTLLTIPAIMTSASAFAFSTSYCETESCESDCSLSVYGDVLYWQTCQSNLDYAIRGDETSPTTSSISSATRHYIEYDWEIGFRVGVQYDFSSSNKFLCAEYVRFHTDAEDSLSDSDIVTPPNLFPVMVATDLSNDQTESIAGKVDTDYDVLDICFGSSYCPSECSTVSVYMGGRAMLLEQNMTIAIGDGNADWTDGDGMSWNSEFTGGGFHIGMSGTTQICQNIDLFADFCGSLLIGAYDSHETFLRQATGDTRDIREKNTCVGVTDAHAAVGLSWTCCLCGLDVSIRGGYEMTRIWGAPEFPRPTGTNADRVSSANTSGSTITFHGAFAGGRISF